MQRRILNEKYNLLPDPRQGGMATVYKARDIATAIPVRTRYEAHLPSHSEDNQIE